MKRRILLVAPYYPPRKRVGALRPWRFARYLKKMGYEVGVLSVAVDPNIPDPHIDEYGIHQFFMKTSFDKTKTSSGSLKKEAATQKSEPSLQDSILNFIDLRLPMDGWFPFFNSKRNRVKQVFTDFAPDLVWSTADPWSTHWLVMKTKPRNIPWIADFRDPWVYCEVRNQDRPQWVRKLDARFERKIIHLADQVHFTSRETLQTYQNMYSEAQQKMKVIYNSFEYWEDAYHARKRMIQEPFRIMFLGRFRPLSSAEIATDLLTQLQTKHKLAPEKVELISFGPLDDDDRLYAESKNCFPYFKNWPPVEIHEINTVLNQADLLLLTTQANRKDIIPQKFWDYLPAKAPILCINDSKELHELVEGSGRGKAFMISDIPSASDWVNSLILQKYTDNYSPSEKVINEYRAERGVEKLANSLEELINT